MPDNPFAEFGPSQNPFAEFGPRATQPPGKPLSWGDVPGEAVSNLGPSAMKFGENLVQPIVHPIDTAKNIKNFALGLVEYAEGVKDGAHKKYADAVGNMIKDRYGSMDALKKTLAADPVGALADFSSVLTGGGAVVRGAAALDRVAGGASAASRVAEAAGGGLARVGADVEPLRAARNVGAAVKEAVAPTGRRAAVQELSEAGVEMTPGQRVGGIGKYVEDKAAALPLLSDLVRHGQNMSIDSFNKVIGNRALRPIGQRVEAAEAGHNMIAEVGGKISTAYNNLLPRLHFNPDVRLLVRLRQITNNDIRPLPQSVQRQFFGIMNNFIQNRRYPMSGPQYKLLESKLGDLADGLMKSTDAYQRQIGLALSKVHTAARSALVRSNSNRPQAAQQLKQINTAWAMYKRMEDAANRRAGSEGIFTTGDMLQASRNAARRGPWARGDAIFQRFAETAHKVLPRKQPESGTPGGHMVTSALAGAAGAAGGAAGAHALGQLAAYGKGAMLGAPVLAAYTKPGMRAFNAAARNPRALAAARNAAVQAGRLPDENDPLAP